MSIFIHHTLKSDTGPKLAKVLHNGKNGFTLDSAEDNFIVNYGRRDSSLAKLNTNIVSNKLDQLKIMQRNNVSVPEWFEMTDINNLRPSYFPLIARKYHHTQGRDAIFLRAPVSLRKRWNRVTRKRDYFIKYIAKSEEYRVHVLGDTIAGISKKIKYSTVMRDSDDEDDAAHQYIPTTAHPHIWSRLRGWIQVDYDGTETESLKELAVRACKALRYDFGAVDIIKDLNGKLYVLEINSAPRLNLRRRRLYCKYFREKQKAFLEGSRHE
jgi:hypothetical protein